VIKVYNTNLEKIWKNSYLWPTGCGSVVTTLKKMFPTNSHEEFNVAFCQMAIVLRSLSPSFEYDFK